MNPPAMKTGASDALVQSDQPSSAMKTGTSLPANSDRQSPAMKTYASDRRSAAMKTGASDAPPQFVRRIA